MDLPVGSRRFLRRHSSVRLLMAVLRHTVIAKRPLRLGHLVVLRIRKALVLVLTWASSEHGAGRGLVGRRRSDTALGAGG